jgi:peptidoglycan hydrolase-like protein with peptidoglycan-binding domain
LTNFPASTPKPEQDTKYNGYSVRQIQTFLTQRGFATKVDGIYGPNTTTQVRAFQRSQGVKADGIVGPVTWSRLTSPRRPTPPAPKVRQTVRRGSTGPDVKYLQQKLGRLKVDGIFGPATERKVRAFQRRQRITVDGIVGPATWSRIG